MKIFDNVYVKGDGKVNFVDDNNVLVGYGMVQDCCEDFGWFLSRKIPSKKNEGAEEINTDGYNFDTSFFKDIVPNDEYFEGGGIVVFRLVNGDEEVFLSLYNSHNGYYSHGFEMVVGGIKIHDSSI